MQIRTYAQWLSYITELAPRLAGKCLLCRGEGEITTECCECGQDKTKDCTCCKGSGRACDMNWADELVAKHVLTWRMYIDAVATDLQMLGEFGKLDLETCAAADMRPLCLLPAEEGTHRATHNGPRSRVYFIQGDNSDAPFFHRYCLPNGCSKALERTEADDEQLAA